MLAQEFNGGYKYDGTGISIGMQDDGRVGPHIDREGRIPMQFPSGDIYSREEMQKVVEGMENNYRVTLDTIHSWNSELFANANIDIEKGVVTQGKIAAIATGIFVSGLVGMLIISAGLELIGLGGGAYRNPKLPILYVLKDMEFHVEHYR